MPVALNLAMTLALTLALLFALNLNLRNYDLGSDPGYALGSEPA
jgi:hypothetical protein